MVGRPGAQGLDGAALHQFQQQVQQLFGGIEANRRAAPARTPIGAPPAPPGASGQRRAPIGAAASGPLGPPLSASPSASSSARASAAVAAALRPVVAAPAPAAASARAVGQSAAPAGRHGESRSPRSRKRERRRSRSRSGARSGGRRSDGAREAKRALQHALQDKSAREAVDAAVAMLELGSKPPQDLLHGLLRLTAVDPGGVDLFAAALQCCVLGGLELDPETYARLLGTLLSRSAAHAQVRAVLNLALPKGSEALPLVPSGASPDEVRAAFESGHVTREGEDADADLSSQPQADDLQVMQALSRLDLASLQGCVKCRARRAEAAYFSHFAVLLHLERLAELQGYQRRLLHSRLEQLQKLGWALVGLEVKATYGRRESRKGTLPGWPDTGSEYVAFSMPQGADPERLRFRRGDTVLLSRGDPMKDRVGEGTLVDLDRSKAIVSFSGKWPSNSKGSKWRMDSYANQAAYERQFAALLHLATAEKPEPVCELLAAGGLGQLDAKAGADRLVGLALEEPPGAAASRLAEAREEAEDLPGCNVSQRAALEDALGRRCTLIQGPPGTGKTHVAVRTLQLWAQKVGLTPVLATSDSNVAVDNIADGLARTGVKVVRVGRPEKVRGHLESVTLDVLLRQDQARRQQEAGTEAEAPQEASGEGSLEQRLEAEIAQRRQRSREDYVAQMRILQGAEVICATASGAGGEILASFAFKAVLVDEVAQATEPSTVVPIVLRSARQLVLVGDHCQLPPAVASREAERRGLARSLFARLVEAGLEPHFLDTQYRSHPRLAEFSARLFYGGKLRSGIAASSRPSPCGVSWPSPQVPVAFVEVGEQEVAEGESKANPAEAERVRQVVQEVLDAGELGSADIGVVTPYSAQVRALRRLLAGYGRELEIASVDSFQGREKELIVFSAVRSNPKGVVGFLADWRRLNVMLTRARRGLVVVGCAATLANDRHWRQWLAWYEEATAPPLGGLG